MTYLRNQQTDTKLSGQKDTCNDQSGKLALDTDTKTTQAVTEKMSLPTMMDHNFSESFSIYLRGPGCCLD